MYCEPPIVTWTRLFSTRNIEEARCILKDCADLVTQAASTVPHSLQIAQSGGGGGGEGGEGGGLRGEDSKTEPVEIHLMDTAETYHSKVVSLFMVYVNVEDGTEW